MSKSCPVCGQVVRLARQKYCSRNCSSKSRSRILEVGSVIGGWEILEGPLVEVGDKRLKYVCACVSCRQIETKPDKSIRRVTFGCRDCFTKRIRSGGLSDGTKKKCACCGEVKSVADFGKHWNQHDKLNARCRRCHRNANLVRSYGITIEDYEEMLDGQHFRCAICGKHASDESDRDLSVDHCHKTGKIRGLLCQVCNCGLGWVGDDPSVLLRAVAYLQKHSEKISVGDI